MEFKGGGLMEILPFILCGVLIFALGICAGILMEQTIHRREAVKAMYNDDFCFNNCKIHEEFYGNHKDPDDAWNALDDSGMCRKCPICLAQDIIDEETLKKWRKKQK